MAKRARAAEVEQPMDQYLAGRVAKGKLSEAQAAQAAANLKLGTGLGSGTTVDFVIEAVIEDL